MKMTHQVPEGQRRIYILIDAHDLLAGRLPLEQHILLPSQTLVV